MSVFPHDESPQQADARAGGGGSGGGKTKEEIVVAASPISPGAVDWGGAATVAREVRAYMIIRRHTGRRAKGQVPGHRWQK